MTKVVKIPVYPFYKGVFALVDQDDLAKVSGYKWSLKKLNYVESKKSKHHKTLKIHRVIMGVTDPKIFVDHRNHNPLDNRKDNLRVCTPSQNLQNRTAWKNGSSKYLGVAKVVNRSGNVFYLSRLNQVYLGSFQDEILAAKAYDAAAREHYGQFANLNFK